VKVFWHDGQFAKGCMFISFPVGRSAVFPLHGTQYKDCIFVCEAKTYFSFYNKGTNSGEAACQQLGTTAREQLRVLILLSTKASAMAECTYVRSTYVPAANHSFGIG
jgi:hypothetical protein